MSWVRGQLVEAGMRVLERDGLTALSARKLAAETGTSTMAVYTHFGGMTELIEALAREAFARFTQALTEVPETEDPVADFLVMASRYREFALANPQRYQMMFGSSAESLNRFHADLTVTGTASEEDDFRVSFDALLTVVRRMMTAGRIRDDGDSAIAGRLWSLSHGEVLLEIAGFFGGEGHGLTQILVPVTLDVLVGMGDDPQRVRQSLAAALDRIRQGSTNERQAPSEPDPTRDDAPRRPSRT